MKFSTIFFLFILMVCQALYAHIFYVDNNHAQAKDSNPGSVEQPWATIQKATHVASAGDIVYVKKGTYKGEVRIESSGEEDAYILFSAFPGDEEQVIIDGAQLVLEEASYVQVSGFYIQNTGKNGIVVHSLSDGVIISGNHTFDTYGSGISVWGVDWGQDPSEYDYDIIRDIVIENNKIEKACNGGWNECITLANGVNGFKILNNEVYNGGDPVNGGEGIDVKEGCCNGIISGNVLHHLSRRGIYLDGGGHMDKWETPPLHDIYVFNNIAYSNAGGQGMAIMTEGSADVHSIYIYNNLFYDNSEDGIMFYDHPGGDGDLYDVVVMNNTCYNNKRFGILLDFPGAENITVSNNICYKSGNTNIRYSAGEHNGSNNLTKNPNFIDAENADFHLSANSPAIDAGTDVGAPETDLDGVARPQGAAFDIGAFEFVASSKVEDCQYSIDNFQLLPNYPNPFNSSTTISFAVPITEHVKLIVYDLLGNEVAVLVDGIVSAGEHTVVFQAENVASGLYFYQLQTQYATMSQRMLLIK